MSTTFSIKESTNKKSWWNVGHVGIQMERKRKKKGVNITSKTETLHISTLIKVRIVPRIYILLNVTGALSTFNSA